MRAPEQARRRAERRVVARPAHADGFGFRCRDGAPDRGGQGEPPGRNAWCEGDAAALESAASPILHSLFLEFQPIRSETGRDPSLLAEVGRFLLTWSDWLGWPLLTWRRWLG